MNGRTGGKISICLNIHLMLNNDLILNILKMSNVKILVSFLPCSLS